MAKGHGANVQKPLYSRVSYLHQAAAYMASLSFKVKPKLISNEDVIEAPKAVRHGGITRDSQASPPNKVVRNMEKHSSCLDQNFIFQAQGVSRKAQIRVSQAMKHSTCHRCKSFLTSPSRSESFVENSSRGARKPWADVLVTRCTQCRGERRIPVGARRQP